MVIEDSTPVVSVIIPTYNPTAQLQKAIESVLMQHIELEVIVIDDGSEVDVKSLLSDKLEEIKLIRQSNKGVAGARNRGLKEAQGHYIAFLDDDDTYLPGSLKNRIECFENHSGTGGVLSASLTLSASGQLKPWLEVSGVEPGKAKLLGRAEFCRLTRKYGYFMIVSFLTTLQMVRDCGGFDERMYVGEDTDLFFRIMQNKPLLFLQKPTFVRLSGGLTANPDNIPRTRQSQYVMVRKYMTHVRESWSKSEAHEFWKFHDVILRQRIKFALLDDDRKSAVKFAEEFEHTWSAKNIAAKIVARLSLVLPSWRRKWR